MVAYDVLLWMVLWIIQTLITLTVKVYCCNRSKLGSDTSHKRGSSSIDETSALAPRVNTNPVKRDGTDMEDPASTAEVESGQKSTCKEKWKNSVSAKSISIIAGVNLPLAYLSGFVLS
eukprot:gb/GECG01007569.1/.p1 GENE.gb/GECG01007569.1/~~gb/GECG01007569.1/.p1  ORF type:complete len:118 (+),score=10.51 gb/GECG01007569.1/:1-354(+)